MKSSAAILSFHFSSLVSYLFFVVQKSSFLCVFKKLSFQTYGKH
jgi:hypothetical protein